MTEETVDRIIRCIKECWWRVGVLLIVLLGFALVAMHGWPEGRWKLDWTALSAISTFFAALVALFIGVASLRSQKETLLAVAHNLKPRVLKKLEIISKRSEGVAHTLGNARQDQWNGNLGFRRVDYKVVKLDEIARQINLLRKEIDELQTIDFSSFGTLDKAMPSILAAFSLDAHSSINYITNGLGLYAREVAYGRRIEHSDALASVAKDLSDDASELAAQLGKAN